MIRFLYHRPLDTLLATWGLSLILQQLYRTVFGAREVGVTLPDWLMGSYQISDTIEVPINGIFVMCLALGISLAVAILMYRSRWGIQVRAVVQNRAMAGAVGINTAKVDRITFALGCGIAGVAGSGQRELYEAILGLRPARGEIYVNGHRIDQPAPRPAYRAPAKKAA